MADKTTNVPGPDPKPLPDAKLKGQPLTPELREWVLRNFREEEAAANLRELRERGGVEFAEFLQELEKAAGNP